MDRQVLRWALPAALLVAFLLLAASPPAYHFLSGRPAAASRLDSLRLPAPTEVVQGEEDRGEFKRRREEWIESLHRAAPGTDWRAIEEANRQTAIARRQVMEKAGVRTSDWQEIGSANLAGRTRCAAWSPDDERLYVGSDNGGVWKGTIAGGDWQPVADDVGYLADVLCVVPGTPKVVTFGGGARLYASTDDGGSWFVPTGLADEDLWDCLRIVRDLGAPRRVYLLTRGEHATHGAGFHLWRSEDGGQSYSFAYDGGNWPRCDIWIDRVAPGPLYLMDGPELKVSTNQGQTFNLVGTAPVDAGHAILTASEAGAPCFYAALRPNSGDWALWRSTNGGAAWEERHPINDFWETLCASIENPDLVFFAGVECWRSADGGGSFERINEWWEYYGDPESLLHADFPGMECLRIDGQEVLFMDTDGGTYVSYDGGLTVHNISLHGLGISQYYDILTSTNDPYLIAAGAQDQGYQQSDPASGRSPFLDFTQLISGDYGHLTSTDHTHNMLYSDYPGFILLQPYEDNQTFLKDLDFPPGASYTWIPFILADPLDSGVLYFCADRLWRYERQGTGFQYTMTELPYDFGGDGGGVLTALAISPADYDRWYTASANGFLWYSSDAGGSWTLSSSTGPSSHYFYGTALIASPSDPLTAYAGGSGYSGPAVYRTIDGGETWEPMGVGLPSTLVFMLAFDNDRDQRLFAAAEAGPFQYNALTGSWEAILGTEAPMTTWWCVEGVPQLGVVRFGTYGRGIWDFTPDPAIAGGLVAGPGPAYGNPPRVQVFPPAQDAAPAFAFTPYGVPHYGANVSTGDLDGNGRDEVLTGAGPGAVFGPHVRGFSVAGAPLPGLSFLAYGTHKFGVNVAAGDLDGDGFEEIVTGAGPGAVFGPHVRGFNYDGSGAVTPMAGVSFLAYGTHKWGVNVSAGDLDGDGFAEIVTGAGPGTVFGPHVRGWNIDGGAAAAIPGVSFLAYGTNHYGVRVACGDVDGDGMAEIVTAPGPSASFGAHLRGWNFDGSGVSPLPGFSVFAWPSTQLRYGASVFAGADLDGDGRDDVVAGAGPDPLAGTPVKAFRYDGSQVTSWFSLEAFPEGFTHGANVAAGNF